MTLNCIFWELLDPVMSRLSLKLGRRKGSLYLAWEGSRVLSRNYKVWLINRIAHWVPDDPTIDTISFRFVLLALKRESSSSLAATMCWILSSALGLRSPLLCSIRSILLCVTRLNPQCSLDWLIWRRKTCDWCSPLTFSWIHLRRHHHLSGCLHQYV